jgi:CheY-like chemotaxis protein/glycine cleavage system H lipoate-binding protein
MSKAIDILIIDDEQVVRDAVSRICAAIGLSVEAAEDARVGLAKIQKSKYRLIVCDVMLPELNAFQLLEEMKRSRVTTPLIMITGYSTTENAVNSLKFGAVDFIPKPFTADELESTLQRGLRRQKFARAGYLYGSKTSEGASFHVLCPTDYFRLGFLSWALIEENGVGRVGVTDLFLKTTCDVKEIILFELNDNLVQGSTCARIESNDNLIHDVLSPLSGRIIERNDVLRSSPQTLEKDPYFNGWLYRIIPTDVAYELKNLTPCTQQT